MRTNGRWLAGMVIVLGGLTAFMVLNEQQAPKEADQSGAVQSAVITTSAPAETEAPEATVNPAIAGQKELEALAAKYSGLGLIDAHNHDASAAKYLVMLNTWKSNNVQQIVLFGDVSESSAVLSDSLAWLAYQYYPELFIPYFSGFDLHDPGCLTVIKNNLEKGYFGLGEIAAASTASPVLSRVEWKADHPMDGYLPQIYDLAAEYKAPLLLHIDPPGGMPIAKLEQALDEHPQTTFIFAHINAYNTSEEIDRLLSAHPNLYADFFAGFTMFNPAGGDAESFIPVMKKFPDRFMISTDSGYGIESEERAIEAIYRFMDLLDDPELARKIAHDNLDAIIQAEPVTKTQLDAIHKLELETGVKYPVKELTKRKAGLILAEAGKG